MAGKGKSKGKGGGNRPALKMVAKLKDSGSRVDLGAAWASDRFPGTYNFKLDEGVRVKAADRDGKEVVLTRDNCYIDIEPPRAARGGQYDEQGEDAGAESEVDF